MAARDFAWKSAYAIGTDPIAIFGSSSRADPDDHIVFKKVSSYDYKNEIFYTGCVTRGASLVECAQVNYPRFQSLVNNFVHELFHVFSVAHGMQPEGSLPDAYRENRDVILQDNSEVMWQANMAWTNSETFADMGVAWTYDVWGPNADSSLYGMGPARQWMETNMADWLP